MEQATALVRADTTKVSTVGQAAGVLLIATVRDGLTRLQRYGMEH